MADLVERLRTKCFWLMRGDGRCDDPKRTSRPGGICVVCMGADRITALESENAELKLRLKEYADTTAEHHKSEKAAWAENAELRAQIESERKEGE